MWRKVQETPYQVAYGILSSIYGFAALFVGPKATPNSIDDSMHSIVVTGWLCALGVGGFIMLVGRLRDWGEVEAAGLTIQTGGILCYLAGAVIVFHAGGNAIFGIVSYTAILLATLVRLSTVRKAIRARRHATVFEGG